MTKQSFRLYKKNKSWVAWVALVIYLCLSAVVIWTTVHYYLSYKDIYLHHTMPPVTAQIFVIFVAVLFVLLNYPQALSLLISFVGLSKKNTIYEPYDKIINTTVITSTPKIAILYVTKDDFIIESFETTLNQEYKNCDVYVLDDSTNPENIEKIRQCAIKHNNSFQIIRREGKGPKNKAGNINNFLSMHIDKYDYFCILDADTYVKPNFVLDCLKYFETFYDVGVVQTTNNCIVNCENNFQDMCAPSYSSNRNFWALDGLVIGEYLTTMCTGHSCMISVKALKEAGGQMPSVISEDWSLSVEMKKAGYWVLYAGNIRSYEETPPNFVAWKKRMLRWQSGAFQFTTQYTGKILKSDFRFYEKIYIIHNACNNWLTPIYTVLLTVLSFVMIYGFPYNEPGFSFKNATTIPWASWVISLVFMALSLTSISCKVVISKAKFSQTLKSLLGTALIGSAMLPSMFVKTITLFFTTQKFQVTIKQNQQFKWYDTFKYNWVDIVGWTLLFGFIITTMAITKFWIFAINPFLWITFASFISLFFIPTMSNKTLKNKKNCEGF